MRLPWRRRWSRNVELTLSSPGTASPNASSDAGSSHPEGSEEALLPQALPPPPVAVAEAHGISERSLFSLPEPKVGDLLQAPDDTDDVETPVAPTLWPAHRAAFDDDVEALREHTTAWSEERWRTDLDCCGTVSYTHLTLPTILLV